MICPTIRLLKNSFMYQKKGGAKMKRKVTVFFGIAIAVLLVAMLLVPQPQALAADKFKLKMQATWPAGSTLFTHFQQICERAKVMSGGRLEIEPLPAGAIVPPFEVLDATSRGVIDGAHTWAAYWTGKHKAAVLMTGGPGGTFGMDYHDYIGWMYEGGGIELYRELYQKVLKLKVEPIPTLPAGPQAFGWFKQPIKDFASFKGMKCRQTGIANDIWTMAGMRPVNMPGGEILPAAERGVIDCAEWVTPGEDMKMGFQDIWKYYYLPGMHENVTMGELIINLDTWNKLPEDLKAILEAACATTYIRWAVWFDQYNAKGMKELREKHGVKIMRTPDEINYKFLETWDKLAAKIAAENPFFKRVLDSQRSYAGLVVPAKRFMYPSYNFAADYYWPEK
jgi:TRAP-type mannitol/chloroaromatic compound transport system substrate-binding protein